MKKEDRNAKDSAWRVRTILELVKTNVKCYGYFRTALDIDEMMVKFKGRLHFRQYIRNKPVRFRIKCGLFVDLMAICTNATSTEGKPLKKMII